MQGGSSGIGYGLKYQARCISDVKVDTDNTSFLTGTLSLKEENEVHLIRLPSGGSELICEGLFSHPNEIWGLASCPCDQRIFSTDVVEGESFGASIWQIPELFGELNSPQLEHITSLDGHVGKIKCILWWPSGRNDKLISIDEENLFLWSLDVSKKDAQVQSHESAGMLHYLSGGAWDPHDVNSVGTTCESSIQFWDLRTMKKTNSVECAHVQNFDYNSKKKHILVTAEHASGIHIWDLRKPKIPIQELPWTYTLVMGCQVVLVQIQPSTCGLLLQASHDELASESQVESPTRKPNPLLNTYSNYEDSVYGIAWSCCEPWTFASLSYDGRVVVESIKPLISKK
ncbi:WD repeat-containing protein DWA2-like [Quillaja saponaria]|uniref:WD repeat-containing protein DWA2-like n=1 Tax=Quillaja saponaria TaxID=32244 RepID=A0AAD7PJJ8_QUISA|nr:WD repeat-containing protein DWA2-like [Quillaja saponaria]